MCGEISERLQCPNERDDRAGDHDSLEQETQAVTTTNSVAHDQSDAGEAHNTDQAMVNQLQLIRREVTHRGLCVVVHPNTTIGRHVSIGHGVTLAAGSNEPGSPYRVIVEEDVIIGSHSMVICRAHEELRLGRGCVVGGGSIVTRSVGPGEIVTGPPARVIGIRSTS